MKIRKHKNNQSFKIAFQTYSSVVVANKKNVGGWEKREMRPGPVQMVFAEGNTAESVRRGFLFGRDRNNTVIRCIIPA